MSYARCAAGVFVMVMLGFAGPAQAQEPRGGDQAEALTIRELLAKSSEARNKGVLDRLFGLMNNLGSLTDRRGTPKPPEMIRAHQKMYDILREHFIANPDKVLEDGFTAFDRLWLDIHLADPGASLDQVFMGHIRKVIAEYEQAQKKKAPTGR